MITTIKKQVMIVECEVLRRGCRIAARQNKAKGNYEKTKRWNDLAYRGDCLIGKIKKVQMF